jgi:cell division protein FtsB
MKIRRALWPLLVSVVLVGVLFAGVFPTRTYLAQRASISRSEKQLDVLGEQNKDLEKRATELQSDAEIERLAREQYNLVKPGEQAYAVLPPPAEQGQETPRVNQPDRKDSGEHRNVFQRAWHAVTSIF